MMEIVTVLIGLDTVTGVWIAFVERRVSSRIALVELVSKLVQFTILVTLSLAVSILTRQWTVVCIMLMGIIGVEALSLLETMTRLEKYGVNLGPIAPLVRRLYRYFSASGLQGGEVQSAETDDKHNHNADSQA